MQQRNISVLLSLLSFCHTLSEKNASISVKKRDYPMGTCYTYRNGDEYLGPPNTFGIKLKRESA